MIFPFFHPATKRLSDTLSAYYENERVTLRNELLEQPRSLRRAIRLAMLERGLRVLFTQLLLWLVLTAIVYSMVKYWLPIHSPFSDLAQVFLTVLEPLVVCWLIQNNPESTAPIDSRWLSATSVFSNHFDNKSGAVRELRAGVAKYQKISSYFFSVYWACFGSLISVFFSATDIPIPFTNIHLSREQFVIAVSLIACFVLMAYAIVIKAPLHWMERTLLILQDE